MSRLSYRGRLFLALLVVSAIPVALMSAAGVYALAVFPEVQGSAAVERVATSTRALLNSLEGVAVAPATEAAMAEQQAAATDLLVKTRNSEALLTRRLPVGLGASVIVAAILLVFSTAVVGSALARQLAAPLDEVVEWTGRIKRREPMPAEASDGAGIPEYAVLRDSLRDLAQSLEQAREAELEAERLRAFGEVARRVAHEMRNPLTPIRLAVSALRRGAPPEWAESLEVIAAESARLEAMSREFAQLGRLPDGVASPVDLSELLGEMLRASVPDTMTGEFIAEADPVVITAHYDPLRRAFSNLLRNAVEACGGEGRVGVHLGVKDGVVAVAIADSGPGVALADRERIFQPYYTDKRDGTGLGLAIVRQTIEQHQGSITVTDTPGGGATFIVRLPL